jgi:hypothetical protein
MISKRGAVTWNSAKRAGHVSQRCDPFNSNLNLIYISGIMSFLHPQRVAHGVAQFCPAAIMLLEGFRRSPVAAYSTSHRVLDLALPLSFTSSNGNQAKARRRQTSSTLR